MGVVDIAFGDGLRYGAPGHADWDVREFGVDADALATPRSVRKEEMS